WTGLHADDHDFYAEDDLDSDTSDAQRLKKTQWDPRWLDAAIKADEQVIVCCLARPGHKASTDYLLKLLEAKQKPQVSNVFEALRRCQYAKLTDLFLAQIQKRTKKAQVIDWELRQLLDCARLLPVADLPKLDAFAGKLDEKFMDSYLEALGPLRQTRQKT